MKKEFLFLPLRIFSLYLNFGKQRVYQNFNIFCVCVTNRFFLFFSFLSDFREK